MLKNKISSFSFLFLFFISWLFSCAPSRFVRPLKKGEKVLSANLGGPLVHVLSTTIPVPLSAVSYGTGIKDDLTLFGGLHTTSLAFGVLQTELGLVYAPLETDTARWYIPGISFSPVANVAVDKWEGNWKLWPAIDFNAYWNYGKKGNYFYIGLSNWFELSRHKAHGERQTTHWIYNPHAGHLFTGKKWNYGWEIKYLAPGSSNQNIVVDYVSPFGNKGAMGVYLTLSRKL